jgi:hypothetical protein
MGPEVIALAQIAGAVFSAVGAIQSGKSEQTARNAQAQVLGQQATRETRIAAQEEDDLRRRVRRLQGTSLARQGASGITGSGSPGLVAEDLAAEAELQALRIRSGGATSSTRLRQEAALERFGGRAAKRQGLVRAGAGLLGGLSRVDFGAFGGDQAP